MKTYEEDTLGSINNSIIRESVIFFKTSNLNIKTHTYIIFL